MSFSLNFRFFRCSSQFNNPHNNLRKIVRTKPSQILPVNNENDVESDASCVKPENVDRASPYSCKKGGTKNGKNICCSGYVCACGSEEISIKDM